MLPALALLGMVLAVMPVLAQPRGFSCVGADQIEDDSFVVAFARGSSAIGEEARNALAAALEAARAMPESNLCVLGHAGQEGGATTTTRLAAARARAVAERLAATGIAPERIRAEARNARFSRRARAAEPPSHTVTIIVVPAP